MIYCVLLQHVMSDDGVPHALLELERRKKPEMERAMMDSLIRHRTALWPLRSVLVHVSARSEAESPGEVRMRDLVWFLAMVC